MSWHDRLQVADELRDFVRDEALPGSGLDEGAFWSGFVAILDYFFPRNRDLLARRDELQARLAQVEQMKSVVIPELVAKLQDIRIRVDELSARRPQRSLTVTRTVAERTLADQSGAEEPSDRVSVFGSLLLLPIQTPTASAGAFGSAGGAR